MKLRKRVGVLTLTGAMLINATGGVFANELVDVTQVPDVRKVKISQIREIGMEKYGEDFRIYNATDEQREELKKIIGDKWKGEKYSSLKKRNIKTDKIAEINEIISSKKREIIKEKYGLETKLTFEQKQEVKKELTEKYGDLIESKKTI